MSVVRDDLSLIVVRRHLDSTLSRSRFNAGYTVNFMQPVLDLASLKVAGDILCHEDEDSRS